NRGEGIDVEDAQCVWHGWRVSVLVFLRPDATIAPAQGWLDQSLRCQRGEPVELDPVNTGERSRSMHVVRISFPFVSMLLVLATPGARAADDAAGGDILEQVIVT